MDDEDAINPLLELSLLQEEREEDEMRNTYHPGGFRETYSQMLRPMMLEEAGQVSLDIFWWLEMRVGITLVPPINNAVIEAG